MLGCCGTAPCVQINDDYHEELTLQENGSYSSGVALMSEAANGVKIVS